MYEQVDYSQYIRMAANDYAANDEPNRADILLDAAQVFERLQFKAQLLDLFLRGLYSDRELATALAEAK